MPRPFTIPNQEAFLPRPAAVAQTQAPVPRRELDERIIDYIMQVLDEPQPQAPQLQAPRQLTGYEAAAGALNPQTIPFFQQRAGQGAALANQQAQQAFESQLAGRREALGLVGPYLQAQAAGARMNRPRTRLAGPIDIGGRPMMLQIQEDPASGEIISVTPIGERAYAPATVQGVVGGQAALGTLSRSTGEFRPATSGGQPVGAVPPAGITQSIAQQTSTLGGLDSLWQAYQRVREQTTGQGGVLDVARQVGGTLVGETRLGGALAPEYAQYVAERRAALNAYIKSQTGAQFSVAELQRYETQYPEPWDPPELAQQKLETLRQRVLADMQVKQQVYPGVGGQTQPPPDDDAAFLERIRQRIGAP